MAEVEAIGTRWWSAQVGRDVRRCNSRMECYVWSFTRSGELTCCDNIQDPKVRR